MLIGGKHLFAKPERHIIVKDFQAWRLVQRGERKRRRFSPQIVLQVGGYEIVLQGYNAVWDFLDCLHQGLRRTELNALMKGYAFDVQQFTVIEELQFIIEESKVEYVCFDVEESGFAKANRRRVLLLPTKKGDMDCSLKFVDGENVVFAILKSPKESLILILGEGGVRPRKGVIARNKGSVAKFIEEHYDMPCEVVGDHQFKLNMFEEEVDELEYLQYIQLIQPPVGKNTGSQ